ncbi:MAG: ribonuclease Y [Deltaproteobacteria bacterium]|nr:ribonuclease Y [Deltaproteobacteria bacterium]
MEIILGSLVGLIVGAVLAAFLVRRNLQGRIDDARSAGEARVADAKKSAEKELSLARQQLQKAEETVGELKKELKATKTNLDKKEERLARKEEVLEKKGDSLDQREMEVARRERIVAEKEKNLADNVEEQERLVREARNSLEKIAGMNQEEARKAIHDHLMDEVKLKAAREIKDIEEEARDEAEKRAKRIVGIAIGRYAGEFTSERTVSVVNLPNEEMKGRIIGREGRNIRAFEAASGVDVIIDDSPDAVIVSGFNPVRREVARAALERLVSDGRIHPARIEEVVETVGREVQQKIREAGDDALFQLALGSMKPELVKLVGQLKYRYSYGQNVLNHSIEVGFLAGLMAEELNMNVKEARRAGLLHDIGKAVDHEIEGPHALIGANFARKNGEPAKIVHAIAAHHEEEKPLTLLAHIVLAADAISGARPGARRESLERYVKRLEDLEGISNSFKGVERSFAIQAGREVRVMVENGKVSDDEAVALAGDIARKIEEELTYPGQIKVCVIRETRALAVAK